MKNPVRFSSTFTFDSAILRRFGAFDPILNADTRLFIDPLLLETSRCPDMREGHRAWISHFSNIVMLLASAPSEDHAAWRAATRAFTFPEVAGTCLGYGKGIRGSGIGTELRARMLRTAKQIIHLGIDNPELFVLIPLIEDDIGPDRISDMTTGIIGRQLAAYTRRVLDGHNIPLETFRIGDMNAQLPRNPVVEPRTPIILVPTDVLRDLPIASDWADVARVSAENETYRLRVSEAIGDIWQASVRRKKKEQMRRSVLGSTEAIRSLLDAVTRSVKEPYDIDRDREGLVHWLEDAGRIVDSNPHAFARPTRRTGHELNKLVSLIIMQFGRLIEHHGLWRHLYVNKRLRHERYPQLLFYAISLNYCQANDIDVSPEANAGGGPVDFKFSDGLRAKVIVEIKYSSNTHLRHGYTEQLTTYKAAEQTAFGYLVVLDVGKGDKQVEAVQELEELARKSDDKHSVVVLIDAKPKRSASRR